MSHATHHDPRSIITPDAFDVAEELLGMPLAKPGRRFWALMIDFVVVGMITLVTQDFGFVLGAVAATFFIRAGFKRTPVKGSVFNRAMRASVGCFGVFLALITATLWWAVGFDFSGDEGDDTSAIPGIVAGGSSNPLAAAVGAIATNALEVAFENSDDLEEAEDEFLDFVEGAEEFGVPREQILGIVIAAIPDDASWAEAAEDRFATLLGEDDGATTPEDRSLRATLEAEVADLSPGAALNSYAALLASDADDDEATLTRDVLRARVITEVARDTLAALERHIDNLEDARSDDRSQLAAAQAALDEANSSGFFNLLRSWAAEIGFGSAWASLYLTVFLSWWNGQTVGKKLMGLRVVRLDGEPITWWTAFERAGGYAAGFATGLLGFAQVYWDANRQGIHDRIVGTVVVLEGAEKVTDWESAL
jgi:RDD family protein